MENPSSLVLQVSNHLAVLYTYSTDTGEVDHAYFGLFLAGIDPLLEEGVKIAKIAISPKRGGRSFRPFGHISLGILVRGPRPSRATTLLSRLSGEMDAHGPKSEIATQRGECSIRCCIPLLYSLIPLSSHPIYLYRSSSASSTSKSRLQDRSLSALGPLISQHYSRGILGLGYVYYAYVKDITNGFYPPLTIRIFRSQRIFPIFEVNISSHGPESWEPILLHNQLLYVHFLWS